MIIDNSGAGGGGGDYSSSTIGANNNHYTNNAGADDNASGAGECKDPSYEDVFHCNDNIVDNSDEGVNCAAVNAVLDSLEATVSFMAMAINRCIDFTKVRYDSVSPVGCLATK
jgi:hypothetical protein